MFTSLFQNTSASGKAFNTLRNDSPPPLAPDDVADAPPPPGLAVPARRGGALSR